MCVYVCVACLGVWPFILHILMNFMTSHQIIKLAHKQANLI